MLCRIISGVLLLLFACPKPAQADELYFVLVFGAQREKPNPDYSHTWAVFVKATPCADGAFALEHHTLSWLPQTLQVNVRKPLQELGVNLDNHSTIRWCLDNEMRVSLWGPYQIEPELYQKSLEQLALLSSGKVRYKAADTGYPTNRVSNCIHGVTHSFERERVRLRVASPGWGETASYLVTQRMERWMINPPQRHGWVAGALGLEQYPIIVRELENPRTGAVWTATRKATGHDNPLGRGVISVGPGSP